MAVGEQFLAFDCSGNNVSELEDHCRGRGAPFCIQSLQQPWYNRLLEAGSLEPPSLCMLEACHLGVIDAEKWRCSRKWFLGTGLHNRGDADEERQRFH